jgi:hypothetical protein
VLHVLKDYRPMSDFTREGPGCALRAGAATSIITPLLGTSLDGPISKRGPARHIHDELCARCLVLSDGETTLGIAVCDSTMIHQDVFDRAKARVAELAGLPASHVMMTATHSHSTPRAVGISRTLLDDSYLDFLSQRIADGLCRAANQLVPARLGVVTLDKPEHLHNRRWHMVEESIPPNAFGETGDRVRMNPPRCDPDLIEPAGPTDPQVTVLSVQHEDGRPLAVLTVYGLHYVGGTGPGEVSADYYGMYCRLLEDALGSVLQDPPFVAILANGASGNVNNTDFRSPAVRAAPYERIRAVAGDLCESVCNALLEVSYVSRARLSCSMTDLALDVRKPEASRIRWAESVLGGSCADQAQGMSRVFAQETLLRADYPDRVRIPLQAFAVGDLVLCAVPCEVFAETGLSIRSASPFRSTAVMSLANAYYGYLPPAEQHELGGYETWPARSSLLEVHAASKIEACILELVGRLAER